MRDNFSSVDKGVPRKKKFGDLLRGPALDQAFKRGVRRAERLRVVFAPSPQQSRCEFSAPVHPKSQKEKDFIRNAFGKCLFFEKLGAREAKTLVDAFERRTVPMGTEIIRQGDIGDYFYIIEIGSVEFIVDGARVGKGYRGTFFGELALLYNSPRAATCIAEVQCSLWRVHQSTFKKIVATFHIKDDDEMKQFLKKVDFLKDLNDEYLTKIACVMTTKTFKAGETVMRSRKGDKLDKFYLVKEGRLVATDIEIGGQKLGDAVEFGPGEHFGGPHMVKDDAAVSGTVTASGKTTIFLINRESFGKVVGDIEHLVRKNLDKRLLEAIQFKNKPWLLPGLAHSLAGLIVQHSFKKNRVFYTEGTETAPTLFLVRSGKVAISNTSGSTKVLCKPAYFGEENLDYFNLGESTVAKNGATVKEDCVVGVLSGRVAASVIGGQGRKAGVGFEELQKQRILGAGSFGQVWLVNKKGTKEAFALKIQFKRQLIDEDQVEGAMREKHVMAKMDSEFIIRLVGSYQDRQNVYMLVKLYQGGELWSIIQNDEGGVLPESAAKFYAASVLEGLSYMHQRHVIHRDLKPENIMINNDGYTVIVDLGFAKFVPERTFTFCGTPFYIAPEIILQRGHDKSADYWSWGVLVYEVICGIGPFHDLNIDEMTLYRRIINGKYVFPESECMSEVAKHLIKRVLIVSPIDRLGNYAGGEKDIQNHPWFDDLDSEKLAKKELIPPWKPGITDPFDVSNFDNWDHHGDKKQKGAPLTAEEQNLFKDF